MIEQPRIARYSRRKTILFTSFWLCFPEIHIKKQQACLPAGLLFSAFVFHQDQANISNGCHRKEQADAGRRLLRIHGEAQQHVTAILYMVHKGTDTNGRQKAHGACGCLTDCQRITSLLLRRIVKNHVGQRTVDAAHGNTVEHII